MILSKENRRFIKMREIKKIIPCISVIGLFAYLLENYMTAKRGKDEPAQQTV